MSTSPEVAPTAARRPAGLPGTGGVDRLLRWRRFPRAFQGGLLAGLAAVAYLAYRPPLHSEMNVGAAVVWQIWWAILPFSVLLFSRLWCAVCPFSLLGEMAESSPLSRRREPSRRLRRLLPWLAVLGLLALGFVFLLSALEMNGPMTAGLLAAFAAATVASGLIWRGKVWCRQLCPAGLMIGLYARLGLLRLDAASAECTPRAARSARGCPAGTSPVSARASQDCLLCGSCLQGPDGAAVAIRFPASASPDAAIRTTEGVAVSLLFGLLVADVLRMTPLYLGYMSRAVPALRGNYELAMALGMVGILASLLLIQCIISLAGSPGHGFVRSFAAISTVLLPLAFAVQLGLSAQHLMITPEVMRNLGAELTLLAPGHIPASGAYYWIWPLKLLQALLLLGGAYLALRLRGPGKSAVTGQAAITTFALLFLFAQPMSITC